MKIECIKDKLQETVNKLDRIPNKNAALPVLSCILFIAKNNTLTLKTTNLDVGVEISIPVKVIEEGIVAVPASVISAAISNIKANKVFLEEMKGFLKVTSENSSVQLKTLPSDEFPLIPRPEGAESYVISMKDFIFGLKAVIFSVSPSSIKPELGSIFINHKDGHLVFAATDSFRLAEKKIPLKSNTQIPQILLPLKNANEFIRVFDGTDEKVNLFISKNQLSAASGAIYFTSRIVDAVFPDYEQIIPSESVSVANVLKQEIVDAIKTTNTIVDRYNQVVFDLDIKKQQLYVKAKNSDVGEGEAFVKTKATGEDVSRSFNQKYISDAASQFSDDSLTFKFGGAHKPLLIEGATNKNFRYIVMPMNR